MTPGSGVEAAGGRVGIGAGGGVDAFLGSGEKGAQAASNTVVVASDIVRTRERVRMMGIAASGRDSKKITRRLASHRGNPAAQVPPSPELARCAEAFAAEFDYLYRTVLRHGVPRQDAEDAVQDVFLTMCRRWNEYDPTRPLRPWLAGIASRAALARRRHGTLAFDPPMASDNGPDPEQRLAASRARALVRAALATLPDRHRTLVIWRDLDELTVTEIAQLQNVSLATASARIRSARRALSRAVHRLVKTGVPGKLLALPPLQTLLALERAARPALRTPRARALDRARAPAEAQTGGSGGLPPGWPRPLLIAGGALGTATALLMMFALDHRNAGSEAARSVRIESALPAALSLSAPAARALAPRFGSALMVPASTTTTTTTTAAVAAGTAARLGATAATAPPAPLVAATAGDASAAGDLAARYPFDERPGATAARDLSGGGNDCPLHGLDPRTAWVPGVHGGALQLGAAGWLDCPRVDRLTALHEEITVAAWIRPPRSRWGMQTIVARQQGRGHADDIFFGLQNDRLMVRSRAFRKQLDRPLPATARPWIHVAFTRAADGTVTLYAAGTPLAHNRGRPTLIGGNRSPLTIGARLTTAAPTDAEDLFAGTIDDLLIVPRALTAEEIAALATGPGASPSLDLRR